MKSRTNYAGTSPITHASGKKNVVAARFEHNDGRWFRRDNAPWRPAQWRNACGPQFSP